MCRNKRMLWLLACASLMAETTDSSSNADTDPLQILRDEPPYFVEFAVAYGDDAGKIASFVVEFVPEWCPRGAHRVRELVDSGYYDQAAFFRVIPEFVAQFGIAADPKRTARWSTRRLLDDPVVGSNRRGIVSFAASGPNTRTTQLFVNTGDNEHLDIEGYAPVGRVISGIEVIDGLNAQYSDLIPQGKVERGGNRFVKSKAPGISFVISARLVGPGRRDGRSLVECSIRDAPIPLLIDVHEDWAPHGAARFLELVKIGYYDSTALFRAVDNFLVQFGIAADMEVRNRWSGKNIPDDIDLHIPIARGALSFAGSGPESRDTQLFISYSFLDFLGKAPWERPIGYVIDGLSALDSIYTGYGDTESGGGGGPNQEQIYREDGYTYLERDFPLLSYFDQCKVVSLRQNSTLTPRTLTHAQHHAIAVAMSPPAPGLVSSAVHGPIFRVHSERVEGARGHSSPSLQQIQAGFIGVLVCVALYCVASSFFVMRRASHATSVCSVLPLQLSACVPEDSKDM